MSRSAKTVAIRNLAVVSAALTFGLLIYFIETRKEHTSLPSTLAAKKTRSPGAAMRALAALQRQQAQRLLARSQPTFDAERSAQLHAALQNPIDITRAAIQGKERKWIPSVVALRDHFLARESRLACANALGDLIVKGCQYTITMAVERTGPDFGVIQRAEGAVRAPDEDADPNEVCQSYANCIALGRVGERIVLPAGSEAVIGVSQDIVSSPLQQDMKDLAKVRAMLEEMVVVVAAVFHMCIPDGSTCYAPL